MRKLASIQRISKLESIENADKIEKATVLGWELVVKKGEFKKDDLCVYCEIDSILPEKPEFEFLRQRKFRIKTIKLRGQVSQGICFPLSILPEGIQVGEDKDVTNDLGIEKWKPHDEVKMCKQNKKVVFPKWFPHWLIRIINRNKFLKKIFYRRSKKRTFPSAIPKTDETRVQVLQPLLSKYKGTKCYITEKIDGSSITIYNINKKFGVCSRRIDLPESKGSKYWQAVNSEHIKSKLYKVFLNEYNIALQGELVGPSIQGNKYKLSEHKIFFFNIYLINQSSYMSYEEFRITCSLLEITTVPILETNVVLSDSIPSIVEHSKGKSTLADISREGIVIRPMDEIREHDVKNGLVHNRVSFKCVNPDFLLKYDL